MKADQETAETIDEYIAEFPKEIQERLHAIRSTIRKAAPDAKEAIKYRIPTFIFCGNLVHFAAFKHHIGFFPTASGIANFKPELAAYKSAKGSVQFPLDQPVPFELIRKIVKFRVKENLERVAARKQKK